MKTRPVKVKWLKQLLIIFLVTGLIAGTASCGKGNGPSAAPIKVGLLPVEDSLPFFVAEQNGYFKEVGIQVEPIIFNSALERDSAFQAGQIDAGVADVVAASAMVQAGVRLKIVSLTVGATPAEGRFAILASPHSPIQAARDLAGVPIAISDNSIIEYVTDQLLAEAGLAPDQIKKTSVAKIPVRLELLLNGKLQAATLPDPFASLAEHQGARVILDDTKAQHNYSQVVILASQSLIDQRPEDLKKLLQACARAGAELNAHPEKYRALMVEKAQVPEAIKDSYAGTKYAVGQIPAPEDIERVVKWMQAKGLLKKPLSYEELVDNRWVKP